MSAHPSASTTPRRPGAARAAVPPGWDVEHEQVVVCHDRATGLRAIIAIHSTALGPALGGTRFFPYASVDDALRDVLALSAGHVRTRTPLAGLDHGGGKAVIVGDPRTDKTEALLRAYGRFVQSLGGRYVTACDVGTYVADMDVVRARPLRHRPLRGRRRRGRLLRAHRVRGLPGHARRGHPPVGRALASQGAGSGSPASARSASTCRGHWSRTAPTSWSTDVDATAVATLQGDAPAGRGRRRHRGPRPRGPRRLRPLRARRGPRRPDRPGAQGHGRVRRGEQPARPPRARGRPRRPRRPLLPRLPGQLRRGDPGRRRAARLRVRPCPRQGVTASTTPRSGCSPRRPTAG